MKKSCFIKLMPVCFMVLAISLLPSAVLAHCDGLDGPVVAAAKKALETENVNLVLIWVQKKDERAIKETFQKTLTVRKLGPEANKLADMYFFETLVRVHRAGEGAPYMGLKSAGRDLGPAIPAADKAVETGNAEPLLKLITGMIKEGLHEQFEKAQAKKKYDKNNIEAGREYIEAYVGYVHYVERLYEAAKKGAHGHYPEASEDEEHGH
ncbi:MAG: DUF6448 family protein [Syntrophales bacterium LBB04]|nr:DUF6448 family protein [Syntrophales bacterium LBB04]